MKTRADAPPAKTPQPAAFQSSIRGSIIYSKFVYEARIYLLLLFTVFNQHVNIFEFQFRKYNLRLFAYIACLCCFRPLQRLKGIVNATYPLNNFGLVPAISFLQFSAAIMVAYLSLHVYDTFSWTRLGFLLY